MKVLNKPLCHNHEKCGNEAMSLVNGMWLCGPCIVLLQKKVNKLKEKLLLEEEYGI